MDTLEQKDIRELIETSGAWSVSLYMPTHRVGREQQQDPIRLKNLFVQAKEMLSDYGADKSEVQEMMRPVQSMITDTDFWQHQSEGLAVLLSTDFSRTFRLPASFDELIMVSKNFHIKPLLPLLNENGQFYILAVSLNSIRLFLGNRDFITEVETPDMPTNMDEALYMDDPEEHLDFHTGTRNPGSPGKQPAMFHGQGKQSDNNEKNILRYFQYVNDGLKKLLDNESTPLVLASVDYLLPIYHNANSHSGLLTDGLTGNPDEMSAKELHQRAWKLIEPIFSENKLKAIKQFKQLHGKQSDRVAAELKTVVKAAKYGQVDTLFVPLSIHRWGRFEQEGDRVKLDEKPSRENEDLLNFAAAQTILNAGQVYALQPEDMPGGEDLAAILRYST
jgi:hypothetical protein